MNKLLLLFFLFSCLVGEAQDIFIGTWTRTFNTPGQPNYASIELQVGEPEAGLIYPAKLTLQTDLFKGDYQLLLTKRNSRKLVFSKNKWPISETPYEMKGILAALNGSIEFFKDLKGQHKLTIQPMPLKKKIPNPLPSNHPDVIAANSIQNWLSNECELTKKDANAWTDSISATTLHPKLTPVYFGLTDTLFVHSKDGAIHFEGNKDNDIISVLLNGKEIIDQIDSKKNREDEEFILDTGLNIISFFCDDFGKNPPGTAAIKLKFDRSTYPLDFREERNEGGAVMSIKVYYQYNKEDFAKFEPGPSNIDITKLYESIAFRAPAADSAMKRKGKIVGNITSHSQQLTFAVWDDAIEDGDTISLTINGKWIVKGFPVLKKPQFITVTLQPGPNLITFVADNLGSIIPNTSVLEIIDGKKRKSFSIETDLLQNNLVNIYYDVKPE